MISSEAQRTLVKSPPELWAELGDPAALARHLGELGEIRIVRSEPERTVEWEAEGIKGTIQLTPSGWGTKVTLTATREAPAPAPSTLEPAPEPSASEPSAPEPPAPEPVREPAPELQATPIAEVTPSVAGTPFVEAEPPVESDVETEPEPRRGFFARFFRRRKEKPTSAREPEQDPELRPEPALVPEPDSEQEEAPTDSQPTESQPTESQPTESQPTESQPDIVVELRALEESLAAETAALLTAVLDRLGAAHHRPFSRA
jgi:hypothetical protein